MSLQGWTNIRFEDIRTLKFSIRFDLIRTSNIKVPNQHGMNKKLDNLVCSRQRSGSSDPRGKVCNRLEVRSQLLLLKITSSTIEPLAKQYHVDASVKRPNGQTFNGKYYDLPFIYYRLYHVGQSFLTAARKSCSEVKTIQT